MHGKQLILEEKLVPLHSLCARMCVTIKHISTIPYHLITVNETRQQKTKPKKPISY